jgi:predicted phosphate transport protein (TIGR00153 family)
MLRVTKKEAVFFKYFQEMIDMAYESSCALEDLMTNYTDIENKIKVITDIEHTCDHHVHKILKQLNATFITPIDREDIYLIAKELDNIIDHIEETAHRFVIFNVKKIKSESIEVAKLITQSISHLQKLLAELVYMKASESMLKEIIEVNRLENQGDVIYRDELTKLFADETDAINVIRWQGIFSYLEKALDACEDVANIIEGVVMKHA